MITIFCYLSISLSFDHSLPTDDAIYWFLLYNFKVKNNFSYLLYCGLVLVHDIGSYLSCLFFPLITLFFELLTKNLRYIKLGIFKVLPSYFFTSLFCFLSSYPSPSVSSLVHAFFFFQAPSPPKFSMPKPVTFLSQPIDVARPYLLLALDKGELSFSKFPPISADS